MKILSNISSFSDVEACDASTLNCYAFCHGYDVRQGLSLPFGNMVVGCDFELQSIHFHNNECKYLCCER